MRVLGIDYGEKKVGIAIGDTEVRVASPLCVFENNATLIHEIANLCSREDVHEVVIGVPVGVSGQHSAQYERAKKFVERLDQELTIPVVMENEVLSTSAARTLTLGNSRGKHDDDVAAMVILQGYLDKIA